jgi:hypothetical protein
MAEYTQKLNLYKPNALDDVQVDTSLSDNFTKIDDEFTEVSSQLAQKASKERLQDIVINVKDYGATGDGVTDDTLAIQTAADALPIGATLYFPKTDNFYKTTSTVTIKENRHVNMLGYIKFYGTVSVPILVCGSSTQTFRGDLNLQVYRNTLSDWTSEENIGIKLVNYYESVIRIGLSLGSTIGAQLIGDSTGFVYNEVYIQKIQDCKYALDLTNKNNGWCNENIFFNGRFAVTTSAISNGKSRYGVRITSQDGLYYNNANTFHKPSFELQQVNASPNEALPVLIEYGNFNNFYDCRNESNGTVFARHLNNSGANNYTLSFSPVNPVVDVSLSSEKTFSIKERKKSFFDSADSFYYSGFLPNKHYNYNSTTYAIEGISLFSSSDSLTTEQRNINGISSNGKYIEMTSGRAIGVRVHLKTSRKMLIKRNYEQGYPGRVRIVCFDESGNRIGSSTEKHIFSQYNVSFGWETYYGGHYSMNSDISGDVYVEFSNAVREALIIFSGGSNVLRLSSFTFSCLDESISVIPKHNEGLPVVSAIPTFGTWNKNQRVYIDNPSAGGYIGAVCTTEGSPGTWKGFGLIEA